VPLELPPLRDRGTVLALLLNQITAELAARHGLNAPRYSRDALRTLKDYAWPGNVRELRNFAERMLVLLGDRDISVDNLPLEMQQQAATNGFSDAFRLPDAGLKLDDLEADMIRQALDRSHGNRSRAARLLGLSRDTLLYRIKKYAIGA